MCAMDSHAYLVLCLASSGSLDSGFLRSMAHVVHVRAYQDEGDMDEDKNCPTHRRPCIERKEENYFFRLSRYQKEIEVRPKP